jgi:hypothetical protein
MSIFLIKSATSQSSSFPIVLTTIVIIITILKHLSQYSAYPFQRKFAGHESLSSVSSSVSALMINLSLHRSLGFLFLFMLSAFLNSVTSPLLQVSKSCQSPCFYHLNNVLDIHNSSRFLILYFLVAVRKNLSM